MSTCAARSQAAKGAALHFLLAAALILASVSTCAAVAPSDSLGGLRHAGFFTAFSAPPGMLLRNRGADSARIFPAVGLGSPLASTLPRRRTEGGLINSLKCQSGPGGAFQISVRAPLPSSPFLPLKTDPLTPLITSCPCPVT